MVAQSRKDGEMYAYFIHRVESKSSSGEYAKVAEAIRECYGKLGFYASAEDFLRMIHIARKFREDRKELCEVMEELAMEAMLIISLYEDVECSDVVKSQIEMYELKNRRYGNSFAECFAKDGYPYAFGHLQEKANRICSLLTSGEEAADEPILDSYKDLFGYCILTLVEIGKIK